MHQDTLSATARLLLIDDTPNGTKQLQELLSEQYYRIYAADTGEEGLELAQHINPDLVLLDIMMPDMDGFEVCRQLKSDKATRTIPIIFLADVDDAEAIVQGLRLGAVDYIARPFNREILSARVRTHIQNGKLTRRLQDAINEKTRELNKANDNLKQLAYQIGMVEEQERRSIAVGLHDGPIQELGWVYMQLDNIKAEPEQESVNDICSNTMSRLDKVIHSLRYMIFDLSPPILYELGFIAALEWLINDFRNRYQFQFDLSSSGNDSDIDTKLAIILFQSTRELMNNVIKHANATSGQVTCTVTERQVVIQVIDDGDGFSNEPLERGDNPYSGFGLYGMRHKLEQHGGQLARLEQGQGAKMQISAPLA